MKGIKPLFEGMDKTGPQVIAGPCSAETEEQVMLTARELSEVGVTIYRAGLWKPRTRPGGFEGVGAEGLPWLCRVREETGMRVATEVANRTHVALAAEAGIDLLWIGTRTSSNPFAMQELAEALAEFCPDTPVLVKNPLSPGTDLWSGAISRLYNAGLRRLGAVHRGFPSYGRSLYRNPPEWRIPIEFRRLHPELPLFCDPSHIAGRRDLVAGLCQQAIDMGFDGLIVECHCDPDNALSDAAQQLTPRSLAGILESLVVRDRKVSTETLTALRSQIDMIDDEILDLLARRMKVACEIGMYKKEHSMPVVQTERYNGLMGERVEKGRAMGLSERFMRDLLQAIHAESVRRQVELVNGTPEAGA